MTSKVHFPNLDASRFLAFLLVFLAHCFIPGNSEVGHNDNFLWLVNYGKLGFLGLEYFFVLSSFLITYLLLTEIFKKGRINTKNFLIRRALRVWPLYFTIVIIGFVGVVIGYHLQIDEIEELPNILYFIFFWVNFYAIHHGMEFIFFLAFLWSISIEEQFYLCWAFLMRYYRKAVFPGFCLLLVLISILFRWHYSDQSNYLYFHTISTLGNFGIGAYAAYIAYYKTNFFKRIIGCNKGIKLSFYLLLLISIFSFHELREFDFFIIIQRSFYALLFAIYILIQALSSKPIFEPGKINMLNYLGKISYGLYCYHGVVIFILVKAIDYTGLTTVGWQSYLLFPVLILILTIALASQSFKYIEQPFLNFKKRFN